MPIGMLVHGSALEEPSSHCLARGGFDRNPLHLCQFSRICRATRSPNAASTIFGHYADPVDPLTVGAGAYGALRVFNVCARTSRDTADGAGFARRMYRIHGTYHITWLGTDFEPSEDDTGFDADQIVDLGNFLSAASTTPVLALLAIANLASQVPDKDLLDPLHDAFVNEARKWNSAKKRSWLPNVDAVWTRLQEIHRDALPSLDFDPTLSDDIGYFEGFVNTPLLRHSAGNFRARFISQLVGLASDIPRLDTALQSATHVSESIAATHLEPIITHTDIGRPADFQDLYVERTFVDLADETTFDSSFLTSGIAPFRIVVTGAPGAGKSTYVQHFRTETGRVNGRPVFVVRCREYAAVNWDKVNLVDFVLDRYNAEYSDELSRTAIRDLLIIGRGIVVFDGLDEVTDPLRRVDFAKRINAFAAQFPIASLLVTSREVGYDRAPVDASLFVRVRLKEFLLDQTTDYVHKWFTLVEREELIERFLHDSESIPDLRLNPLMLSLLCLLYRESGAIPSRRLDIYDECARLLFHRWDRHRQIEVDGSIPDFADNLMQEIARWFFTSPTAQAGLGETLIQRMLKRILIDQSGFPEGKAQQAATDFLDFCSGRAWLLGNIGSNHKGERLFSFTHKTFYEYFAAESFARHSNNATEVSDRIATVFANDTSSVLPELLIQSYGKHSAQGAARVIKDLSGRSSPLLMLRLLEGASLPAASRQLVFRSLAYNWENDHRSYPVLIALLQLNPIAREQFVTEHLETNAKLRSVFLSGWAGIVLSGASERYGHTWGQTVDSLANYSPLAELAESDGAIWNWLTVRGVDLDRPADDWLPLVCGGMFGYVPGVLWFAIQQKLRRRENGPNEQVILQYTNSVLAQLNARSKIPRQTMAQFMTAMDTINRRLNIGGGVARCRSIGRVSSAVFASACLYFPGGLRVQRIDHSYRSRLVGVGWEVA